MLTCASSYEKTWSASAGSAPVTDESNHTVTWTGSTSSALTLTNTDGAQSRVQNISVTYSSGSGSGSGGSGDSGDSGDSGNSGDPGNDGGNSGSSTTYVYKKVTSQSDIVEGGVYLIVCENLNTTMSHQNTNRRYPASVTITNNTISVSSSDINTDNHPFEVTLGKNGDVFTMTTSGGKYLGNGSSSNYLKEVQSYNTGYGWTLTYVSSNKTVTMTTNHTTKRTLCVNTSNEDCYATYTDNSSYSKVTLYKKQEPNPTITIGAAGVTTYYHSTRAYKMPTGLTGYYVNDAVGDGGFGYLQLVDAYPAGTVVPAGEALIIRGAAETYELVEGITGYPAYNDNLLKGTDAAATTTGGDVYYMLAVDPTTGLGFYWGAANGVAFTNGAHKAYLALTSAQAGTAAAKGFTLNFDEVSGIKAIENFKNESNAAYNLNGQRVNANQKGIVIVNGRKYINK